MRSLVGVVTDSGIVAARALALTALLLIAGCGGGGSGDGGGGIIISTSPKPAAFGLDAYRPNYGGDLAEAYYWPQTTVKYRIVDPAHATDIHLVPISAVAATTQQATGIREDFTKWQTALNGVRQFVEVDASDTTANIDVVLQNSSQFSSGPVTEQLGVTDQYVSDTATGTMGRAVIRLRNDQDDRTFRYITLHEQGHALGFLGHSRQVGDVMFAIVLPFTPLVDLTQRDINTIRADYVRP